MILKVAWRNIWRNKIRSLVVIMAIAVGLWAGVFASAFVVGMMEQKIDNVIELEMSHFQIHHSEFREENLPKFTIENSGDILKAIEKNEYVLGVAPRVKNMPMIASPYNSGVVMITGIDPDEESKVTIVNDHIIEGKYFGTKKKNPILISKKTAEKFKLKLRSKPVLTVQNVESEIIGGAFSVIGIYDTKNSMYDEMNAFVLKEDLQRLLGIGNEIHEIAILLKEHELAGPIADTYQKKWSELEVRSWKDLTPAMRLMVESMDVYTLVIVAIILLALLFSIINTMLMAVLERVREIGMLMAVGMTKTRVFLMIMSETVLLTIIGGPLGLLLAWSSVNYFGKKGIDLGNAAYGDMGFSNTIFPYLETATYVEIAIMVIGMAILAAVYPAYKALKLKPVEAIRKI